MEYNLLGTIIGTHGLDGNIKFISSSYFLEERLQEGNLVYLGKDINSLQKYEVEYFRYSPKYISLKLKGIDSIEFAEKLKGVSIFVLKEDLVLDQGMYYFSDLQKCEVFDELNNFLGKVIKVEEFPAQITLRVKSKSGKVFFVPFIEQFIIDINIIDKSIKIKVIEGMLWKSQY